MKISELMERDVITCGPDEDLASAAGKMWDKDIGCLPVINEIGQVKGMITDRDICMAACTQGRSPCDIPARMAMSRELFSCTPDATIAEVEEIMLANQVHRLPVLDPEGKLLGIVSLNDLVREVKREAGRGKIDVTADEVIGTLAGVYRPRKEFHA